MTLQVSKTCLTLVQQWAPCVQNRTRTMDIGQQTNWMDQPRNPQRTLLWARLMSLGTICWPRLGTGGLRYQVGGGNEAKDYQYFGLTDCNLLLTLDNDAVLITGFQKKARITFNDLISESSWLVIVLSFLITPPEVSDGTTSTGLR